MSLILGASGADAGARAGASPALPPPYEAALRGDFVPADALRADPRARTDAPIAALCHALAAARWHAEPGRGALPDPERIGAFVAQSPDAADAAALACVQAEKAAVLALDCRSLSRWIDLHARLSERGGDVAARWLEAAVAWRDLLDGECEPAIARTAELSRRALDARDAALVLECASLRALASLAAGDLVEALASARRAARMARTESMPQLEYLAGIVLARVRRYSGKPHLAVRILAALARIAPTTWSTWLGWELVFAGGLGALRESAIAPGGASKRVRSLLVAAERGDRAAYTRALDEARGATDARPWREELETFAIALDPEVTPATRAGAPDALVQFLCGADATLPCGLAGEDSTDTDADTASPTAAVAVWPDRAARRVLPCGVALLGRARRLLQSSRPGRTETAIAVLALAPDRRMHRAELFQSVYGFSYAPELHEGPLRVLIHRARALLSGVASIERDADDILLAVGAPFAVPDPRCMTAADDRLLRVLARRGARTARDAAADLGIPLRTAQALLGQLVADGAIIAEKHGRLVEYRIEDTTFSEPTRR